MKTDIFVLILVPNETFFSIARKLPQIIPEAPVSSAGTASTLLKSDTHLAEASLASVDSSRTSSTDDSYADGRATPTTSSGAASSFDSSSAEQRTLLRVVEDGVDLEAELAPVANKSAIELAGDTPSPQFNWFNFVRKTKEFAPMALSMAFSNVVYMMNGVILLMFVGRLGETQAAAAGLANFYIAVTGIAFCTGLLAAEDTLCSQAFGAGNLKRVSLVFQRSIAIIMLVAIPVSILWLFTTPLLLALKQDPAVAKLAGTFVLIYLPSLPAYLVMDALKRFLVVQHIALPALIATLSANIICVALGAWLILATKLGVYGMPLCMALSNFLGVAFLGGWTLYKRLHVPTWRTITMKELLDMKENKDFMKLGIPGALMLCAEWIGFEIHGLMSGWLGVTPLAAQAILLNTNYTIFSFPLGMSIATTVMVGNNMGMGQYKEAFLSYLVGFIDIEVIMVVLSVTLFSLHTVWGKIFSNVPEVVALVAKTLPAMVLFLCADAAGGIGSGAIRGVGQQVKAAICNLVAFYVVGVPLGYILAFPVGADMGLPGLWLGLAAASYTSAGLVHSILLFGNWQKWAETALERAKADEAYAAESVDMDTLPHNDDRQVSLDGHHIKLDFDTPSKMRTSAVSKDTDRSVAQLNF